jgi:hypothetical protein
MILVLTANSIRLAFSRESGNASAMGNMLKLIWWAVIGLFRSSNWLRVSRTGQICPYTFDKLGLFMSFAAV